MAEPGGRAWLSYGPQPWPRVPGLQVLDIYARVRAAFPGARVAASGFDAFVRPLLAAVERGAVELPVVTAEIGARGQACRQLLACCRLAAAWTCSHLRCHVTL